MTQALEIAYCNLQSQRNNALHYTAEISDSRLIVRRGQPFLIALEFKDRDFQEGTDNIVFAVETGPWPDEPSGTKAVFPLRKALIRKAWSAAVESRGPKSLGVVIMPSSNAIIGQYTLKVQIAKGNKYTNYKLGTFVLLFNPWCADDDVFLDNRAALQEYVMNDYGFVYQGNHNWITPCPWNYGQFEDDIVDISLRLLDKNLNYLQDAFKDLSHRDSPVYISRVVCAMINSNDDSGVLQGNWSEDYKSGVCPSAWNGSTAILRKWYKRDCEPVRYGQCWVFAAVMCTVMRCLGIPTRVVSNFDSAHDTNNNLIIDEYYDTTGKKLPKESHDSIWNFHVWCECWMARKDLPPGYGGWQVLDPTPQETSNGIYCCGPASVKAIKEGEVHLNYDCPFVFSMVNADCVSWTIYGTNKEKLFCDPHLIGNRISTKSVGTDDREDITHTYKYDEGTTEERKVFRKALQRLRGRGITLPSNGVPYSSMANGFSSNGVPSPEHEPELDSDKLNHPLKDAKLVMKFQLTESPQLGQTIRLALMSVNLLSVPKTLKLSFSAQSLKHTGKPGIQFWKDSKYIELEPKEEKWLLMHIPYSKYGKYLEENNLLRVTAVGEQNVTWEKVLVEKDINLAMPQIGINPKGSARVNQPCKVQLTFSNPLNEVVNDCLTLIEGSGLLKNQMKILVGTMEAKERSVLEIELVPYKVGLKQLQVNFSSNKFQDIKGHRTIVKNINAKKENTSLPLPNMSRQEIPRDAAMSATPPRHAHSSHRTRQEAAVVTDNMVCGTDKGILQPLGMPQRKQSTAELHIGNMKQDLPIRCDLQVSQNNTSHRTISLSQETRLYLRRGQEFTIGLKFRDKTLRQKDLGQFSLITTTGPNPSKLNRTKTTFPVSSLGNRKTWSARVVDYIRGTWKVAVTSPADAIIGHYSLLIKLNNGFTQDLGEFMMLFNPWSEDDQVYLCNEAERREFVLSEDGIIYLGTESAAQPHPWHFGQFEEDIPNICLKFLDMSPRYQKEPESNYVKRNDPVYIIREIGDMIGRWDETDRVNFMCENGRPSYTLVSSVPILHQWLKSQTETAYGHHWVFAALLCTALRCLGIPTRVVTNYNSAYDTDRTLQKDIYYDKNGARIHRSRNDSIWHFNVWNECWMERTDLRREYSGWQVLDATAQLKYSGELYCSGPAPVRAVKSGDVGLTYDTNLIFSKIHTDTVVSIRDSIGCFRRAYSLIRYVGDAISTKSVRSDAQDDITLDYKYAKGSKEEHEALERVKQLMLPSEQDTDHNLEALSPIVVSITSKNKQPYGEDIGLSATVSNVGEEEKDLELVLGAQSVHDYGITRAQFWSQKFHFHLLPGEAIRVSGRMNFSAYKEELLDNNLMRITALLKEPQHEDGRYALADDDVTIYKPSLAIQMPMVALQFQPITAMVALSNPLKKTLKQCEIRTSGKGLIHGEKVYRCKDVLPGGNLLYPLTFMPTQVGERRLYVQVRSDKLGVIHGFQGLEVLSSDVQEWATHHWEEFQKYTEGNARNDPFPSLTIQTMDTVLFGQDIPITMKVPNDSQIKKNVCVFLCAQYLDDNGNGCPYFWKEQSELSLQENKDNIVKAQIHPMDYAVSPSETNEIRLIGLVKDVADTRCISKKLVMLKPKVVIQVPEEALQYQLLTVTVSITNPLEEKLESCVITVSGEGLIHKERSYSFDSIDPNTTERRTITFSPSRSGTRKLHVGFHCTQFRGVRSSHGIDVLPADIPPIRMKKMPI
ncbi:LOW QUALITY PROTEIN: uncharacterized protein LOC130297672 [Hyla sarda]|uniref:LOW QUALITY PROTEIN: uncharacterized protein LOC130297672 n=1 Tax=Hyla sarda TaxID=327740 RepID=UPI0024C3C420|nr:LOW QUALITY PROTEIN: uncharacterized protein LOC130297672 [Hyla sarda]